MDKSDSVAKRDRQVGESAPQSLVVTVDDGQSVASDQFQRSFGEDIRQTLDIDTWRVGTDLSSEYDRIESEVQQAVERESALETRIREHVFPRLKRGKNLPKNAGVHPAQRELLENIHSGLLFNGGVEACDGVLHVHETLPLTIYQLGVSLVSYQGDQGVWGQRLSAATFGKRSKTRLTTRLQHWKDDRNERVPKATALVSLSKKRCWILPSEPFCYTGLRRLGEWE
jgi:hypothetical protein